MVRRQSYHKPHQPPHVQKKKNEDEKQSPFPLPPNLTNCFVKQDKKPKHHHICIKNMKKTHLDLFFLLLLCYALLLCSLMQPTLDVDASLRLLLAGQLAPRATQILRSSSSLALADTIVS